MWLLPFLSHFIVVIRVYTLERSFCTKRYTKGIYYQKEIIIDRCRKNLAEYRRILLFKLINRLIFILNYLVVNTLNQNDMKILVILDCKSIFQFSFRDFRKIGRWITSVLKTYKKSKEKIESLMSVIVYLRVKDR